MNFHDQLTQCGKMLNKHAGITAVYRRGDVSFPITVNKSMLAVEDLQVSPHTPVTLFFTNFYMERADLVVDGVDYFPPKFGDKLVPQQGTFRIVGRQGQYEMTALMSSDSASTYDWVTSEQTRIIVTGLKEA